jgi:hypothetical protein
MIEPEGGGHPGSHQFPAAGRILPAADVFLDVDVLPVVEPSATGTSLAPSRRLPGPGIWESIAWMTGVHIVQLISGVAAALFLAAAFVVTTGGDALQSHLATEVGQQTITAEVVRFFTDNLIYLIGAAQLGTVAFGLAAIRLRFGRQGLSRLGWQLPSAGHWLPILLFVLPLSLLCAELQKHMFELFPAAHLEMAELMKAMAQASLPALVLVIGAGPAVGEELIFRGLIGRGLLARWGFLPGILITSILFGVMHINPAQAIGVIPLGIAMHFLYLTTRSFWAPIILHLANNSLSVVLLKLQDDLPISRMFDDGTDLPLHVGVASAAVITAIALFLWQTRVQYALPDGTIWNPGYLSAEVPPPEAGAHPVRQNAHLLLLAASILNSLGFVAVLWRLATAS